MKLEIFSFFSGAGFLDLGFEKSGYEVVFANEIDSDFADVYEYSRRVMGMPSPIFGLQRCDIRLFLADRAEELMVNMRTIKKEPDTLVGFIGGPPCPDFSVAGKNKGAAGNHGILSQIYADLICQTRPDFFLFENVKGLWRTAKHRSFFDGMAKQLEDNGYALTSRLVNALEYGAPQDRDRILLIGVRSDVIRNPGGMKAFPWTEGLKRSLEQIKALPWPGTEPFAEGGYRPPPDGIILEQTVQYWFNLNDVANHPNAGDYFKPRAGLARFLTVEEGDDSKKSYKRLHRWRYSPTVAYGNNEVHLHPYLPRRLSAAEALSLQSLPKEFILPPTLSLSSKFKTIGNGVPYVLAREIALRLKSFLAKETSK